MTLMAFARRLLPAGLPCAAMTLAAEASAAADDASPQAVFDRWVDAVHAGYPSWSEA